MTTERDIRNQNAYEREMAMKEGMERGMEKGIADTARNMKTEGIPAEVIGRVTGLSAEQIAAL